MEAILMSPNRQSYVWKAVNVSSKWATTLEIKFKIEEMISKINELNIPLLAIITDNAPAYNAAK